MKAINVQVNPYLEFMNSILLTSRYNELTMPYVGYGLMTAVQNEYTGAIKQFLNEYHNEPVYKTIEDMIPNGFTFSRPVELMLSLGSGNDFSIQHQLSPLCVQYCGGMEQISKLLRSLKDFESKIHFFEFFDTIKSFYATIVQKTSESLGRYPFVDLIEQEFGKSQNSYNYILSSLMVGNFGISFVDYKTYGADLFSVFSTDDFSLSPRILIHEFSHSFINPLTDKYYDLAEKYIPSYEKLKDLKLPDYQSGYGDFKECINEHLVRAMSIHLLKQINHTDSANVQLKNDFYSGYRFIEKILERYDYYDRNRTQYSSIEEFYPELLGSFDMKYLKVML